MPTEAQKESARDAILKAARTAQVGLATQQQALLQEVRAIKDRARLGAGRPLDAEERAEIDRLLAAAGACGSAIEDVALVTIEALESDPEVRFLTHAFADLNGTLERSLKRVEHVALVAANIAKVVGAIEKIVVKLAVLAA